MTTSFLKINNLSVQYTQGRTNNYAVSDLNIDLKKGQSYAIVGESGCGKSTVAMAIMGLLKKDSANIYGEILFNDRDLINLRPKSLAEIRGKKIAMIFQDPMSSLNPFMTIGDQITEQIIRHKKTNKKDAEKEAIQLLHQVGIKNPDQAIKKYPHEFSGGMRQRVMIATALSCDPEILIADEPTTALDVTIQAQILKIIKKEVSRRNMSLLLITHDLGVVAGIADQVAVMYAGKLVEEATAERIFEHPTHPYTQGLIHSLPKPALKSKKLFNIKGQPPVISEKQNICSFYERCHARIDECKTKHLQYLTPIPQHKVLCIFDQSKNLTEEGLAKSKLKVSDQTVLKVNNLVVQYPIKKNFWAKKSYFTAVDDVSINLKKGETLAIVGESGCGKSSFVRGALQLVKPKNGQIILNEKDITNCSRNDLNHSRKEMQLIFQDPYSSLNSRMKIRDIIAEPMKNLKKMSDQEIQKKLEELVTQTGLQMDWLDRYPHQFSGGQRQRICIARALAVEPQVLFCDEPVSALDVSIQAQILNLLSDLKESLNLSIIFISHDLSVVNQIADRVIVMYKGKIVEQGLTDTIFNKPEHPYTKLLINSAPVPDPKIEKKKMEHSTEIGHFETSEI